jgi:hypothetical protein
MTNEIPSVEVTDSSTCSQQGGVPALTVSRLFPSVSRLEPHKAASSRVIFGERTKGMKGMERTKGIGREKTQAAQNRVPKNPAARNCPELPAWRIFFTAEAQRVLATKMRKKNQKWVKSDPKL